MTEKTETQDFKSFGFSSEIMEGIEAAGFKIPSPIQSEAIPAVMAGKDIIGQAHTGTGKTAAFGLPLMNNMEKTQEIQLLVVTPTRELADQVSEELYKLGRFAGIKTGCIFGGRSYSAQYKLLDKGAHIITATPGRLLDLLKSGKVKNFAPKAVVLDEADEMLDMGFLEDVKEIFNYLPEERQTLLFSATMPKAILNLSKKILNDPVVIATSEDEETTNQDINQLYYVIEENERDEAVLRLMEEQQAEKSMVFCRTRLEVDRLCTQMVALGHNAKSLHGDMDQSLRLRVMDAFRKGQVDILVATDVAARGLDVSDVTHVFNYHIPFDSKSYVHRIGRTGRAGKKGTAITLVTPQEYYKLERIKRRVGAEITFGAVPTLKELRINRLQRLQDLVASSKPGIDIMNMISSMEEKFSLRQIAACFAEMLAGIQDENAPESIGISEERLKEILNRREGRRRREGGGGGGRRRSGGGGRRSGGGGGRDGNRRRRPRSEGGGDRRRSGGGDGNRRSSGGGGGNRRRRSSK